MQLFKITIDSIIDSDAITLTNLHALIDSSNVDPERARNADIAAAAGAFVHALEDEFSVVCCEKRIVSCELFGFL